MNLRFGSTKLLSPLDINLTKWLSRCEGSFNKGKRKTQLNGDDDDKIKGRNHIKKQEQEEQNRIDICKELKDKEERNMKRNG